jgi:hypothetical protein
VWRARDEDSNALVDAGWTDLWQVGAGLGFALGDMATLSLAGAFGEGPFETVAGSGSNQAGEITSAAPYNQSWWGISALASANLTDAVHAEDAGGYKKREGDSLTGVLDLDDPKDETFDGTRVWRSGGADYEVFAVLGGLYYDPVDQLTLGVEGEYYTTDESISANVTDYQNLGEGEFEVLDQYKEKYTLDRTNFSVDFVAVWRF